MPVTEHHEQSIEVCIAITNMSKTLNDAMLGRSCGQGMYLVMMDMFRKLQHNSFWKVFGAEVTNRFANGLARAKEQADATAKGYKPDSEIKVAEYMAHQFAWIDALVFIAEVMGHEEITEFRDDIRKTLYGM